jgi:hypothetical protein
MIHPTEWEMHEVRYCSVSGIDFKRLESPFLSPKETCTYEAFQRDLVNAFKSKRLFIFGRLYEFA